MFSVLNSPWTAVPGTKSRQDLIRKIVQDEDAWWWPSLNILWFNHLFSSSHRIHGAAIYGNIYPINIPQMLAYIPAPWILWVLECGNLSSYFFSEIFSQFCCQQHFWMLVKNHNLLLVKIACPLLPPCIHSPFSKISPKISPRSSFIFQDFPKI